MNKYQQALNNCVNRWAPAADWNLLKELVDKATPKKPKNWTVRYRGIEFNCPTCKTVHHNKFNFCTCCGQALDWGTGNNVMTIFEALNTPLFSIEELRTLIDTEITVLETKKKELQREIYTSQLEVLKNIKKQLNFAFEKKAEKL